jgi:hypothetical protein
MKFKSMSGKAPGPPRMAAKPAGNGGSPKNGQILSGSKQAQAKHGPGDAPSPPKPKVGKGGNGMFKPPKGKY